jgi:anti-sigma28 factor (negative regulator of flagellin synthesis)
MRIYDTNLTGASAAEAGRTQDIQKTDRTGSGQASAGLGASDRVELSSGLGRLSQALASFQESRAGRVAVLAAQFQSGNYRPDPAAIGRAMISETLDAGVNSAE